MSQFDSVSTTALSIHDPAFMAGDIPMNWLKRLFRPHRPSLWHSFLALYPRSTPTGMKEGPLMRRKRDDGSYEYREMTHEEEREWHYWWMTK